MPLPHVPARSEFTIDYSLQLLTVIYLHVSMEKHVFDACSLCTYYTCLALVIAHFIDVIPLRLQNINGLMLWLKLIIA